MANAKAAAALVLTCALLMAASPGFAQVSQVPTSAPRNPAFVDYLQRVFTTSSAESYDARSYGLIPSPVDLSHASKLRVFRTSVASQSLPETFDLRTASPTKLTAVRDQGSCGSCWAFGAYGSLESCLLPGTTADFSENHMKNTAGFDWACCEGGNQYMVTAYLARWSGPVYETSDPYSASSCTSPSGLQPVYHVQNVDFLPDRASSLDNDTIKQAVMDKGAVYTTLYMTESSSYFSSTNKALYYTGTAASNHAICIVGWDDNYSASNFAAAPPGNGAFIIRNSWGSWWGLSGYFYVSYYDVKVGHDNAVLTEVEAVSNYDRIYDYDPLGWTSSLGYGDTTAWFANVFTSASNGELRAVSFYTASPSSTYEVRIYQDPDSGPMSSAGYATSQTGTTSTMGYHTVVLNTPVQLASGHKFSVAVELTTPGYNYPIPYEEPASDYSSQATANSGESYISYDGSSWTDLTSVYTGSNVCIKAFASDAPGLVVSPGAGLTAEGPIGGPFSPASQAYTLTNTGTASVNWAAESDQPWLSVMPNGGSLGPGDSITVTAEFGASASALPSGTYAGNVTFTNVTTGIGTTSRPVSLSVYGSYTVGETPYNWIDPSAHTALTLGDDGVSAAQQLPFSFSYYGNTYTQLYVGANGMIGFAADGLNAYQNANIPSAGAPNAVLCPYWDDLNPAGGGSVRIGTEGAAPNRRLVVSWVGVPHYSSSSATLTFQAVLCEGTDDIIFNYQDVKPNETTYGGGRSATVGIENATGSAGTKYSYNGSALLRNSMALLFTSRGPAISAVKAYPAGTAVSIGRAVATAVLDDAFYIESDNRLCGIRVHKAGHSVTRWARADVSGTVQTNSDGERYIEATYAAPTGAGTLAPLAIAGSALGGGDMSYDASSGTGQQGMMAWRSNGGDWTLTKMTGVNNIGLYVQTWGRVTWAEADVFYVDDGSMLKDNSAYTGIRVYAPGLIAPAQGSYVRIAGISSCFAADGVVYRQVLVTDQGDIGVVE